MKSQRNLQTLSRFSFCVAILVFNLVVFKPANSVTTVNHENGGYTFTIAIDEGVPEPASATALATYIGNIRTTLQRFTLQLFLSTNGAFHVENVQILLPASWNNTLTSSYPPASTESYSTSDIRLSTLVTAPYVANPHPCGLPGKYIELPHEFLSGQPEDGTYGPLVKALLTQWARFRWGVWEEHGYPGGSRFPYFYRTIPSNEQSVETTSCSNERLEGEYRTVGTDEICTTLDENCRFKPAYTNKATSSLMGFHWLETVTEFCNEANHNRLAPNKQNLYCDRRSVWEVIRTSLDYHTFDPLDVVPVPNVNVVRASTYPALHIVLDRGLVQDLNNIVLVNEIIRNLPPLFDLEGQTNQNVVAALSIFNNRGFQTLVPWKKIAGNEDEFLDKLGQVETDFPPIRDFSTALLDVTSSVESLNALGGAVVLFVKTGGVETFYGSLQPEEEVAAAISKAKIRLFTAEVRNSVDLPFVNLKDLVERTGGIHHQFDDPATATEQIQTIVRQIRNVLDQPAELIPIEETTQVLFKGLVAPTELRTIIQPNGISNVQIHVSVADGTVPVLQIAGITIPGTSRNEWDEAHDFTRRIVYTFDVPAELLGNLRIQYSCGDCDTTTEARVLVGGKPSASSPNANVEVFVETTAINNRVELSETSQPFAIYATVLYNHKPVKDVTVRALATDSNGLEHVIELLDDGTGYPDIEKGDGVYSATYIPPSSRSYRISVKVESGASSSSSSSSLASGNEHSRLLPIDQEQIGCPNVECDAVPLDEVYSNVFEIGDITFSNVDRFPQGTPGKILDLSAVVIRGPEPDDMRLRLRFSSPKIVGVPNPNAKASRYYILGSNTLDALLSDIPNGELIQEITDVSPPGSTETYRADSPGLNEQYFSYYIVHTTYSNFPVIPTERIMKSNIAQLVEGTDDDDENPTPTPEPPTGETSTDEPGEGTTSTTTTTTRTTTTTDTPPSTTEGYGTTSKPFFKRAGGIVVIILIVLIVLGAIGGGGYYFMKKRNNSKTLLDEDRSQRI